MTTASSILRRMRDDRPAPMKHLLGWLYDRALEGHASINFIGYLPAVHQGRGVYHQDLRETTVPTTLLLALCAHMLRKEKGVRP